MRDHITLAEIDQAAQAVRGRIEKLPKVALVLGSGLGGLAALVENATTIPYEEIPFWPVSTVEGHAGRLVIGQLEGVQVAVMQGRSHYYEGYSMAEVTMPVRVFKRLGVETLVLTNAAGAINPDFNPGDVMLITDHLSLMTMAGANPLRGPNIDEFGPRFPDMSRVYDRDYQGILREVANQANILLHTGVYVGLAGPSFETPADLRFLRGIGADAVGMSTVPEAIVAHHAGMRVAGLSGISNKANLDGNTETTHAEVLAAGQVIAPKLTGLVRGFLRRVA